VTGWRMRWRMQPSTRCQNVVVLACQRASTPLRQPSYSRRSPVDRSSATSAPVRGQSASPKLSGLDRVAHFRVGVRIHPHHLVTFALSCATMSGTQLEPRLWWLWDRVAAPGTRRCVSKVGTSHTQRRHNRRRRGTEARGTRTFSAVQQNQGRGSWEAPAASVLRLQVSATLRELSDHLERLQPPPGAELQGSLSRLQALAGAAASRLEESSSQLETESVIDLLLWIDYQARLLLALTDVLADNAA
jgi:hypothetical protein